MGRCGAAARWPTCAGGPAGLPVTHGMMTRLRWVDVELATVDTRVSSNVGRCRCGRRCGRSWNCADWGTAARRMVATVSSRGEVTESSEMLIGLRGRLIWRDEYSTGDTGRGGGGRETCLVMTMGSAGCQGDGRPWCEGAPMDSTVESDGMYCKLLGRDSNELPTAPEPPEDRIASRAASTAVSTVSAA